MTLAVETSPWLATARSLIGKVEDGPSILPLAQKIGQSYPEMAAYCAQVYPAMPWCGLFVAYCLTLNGIRPVFGATDTDRFLWAQAWKQQKGQHLGAPVRGCIMVLASHVTIYDRTENGRYICVGGNQSDQAKESSYDPGDIEDMVWPAVAIVQSEPPVEIDAWQSGKGSVYSWFTGKYVWEDPGDKRNSNKLGVSDEYQGISFLDDSTLGQWFEVEAPNGVRSIEQHTEKGPATWTGRLIDISAVAAERFGYTPRNFPTDSIFKWRPTAVPGGLEGLPPKDQAEQWYRIRSDPNVPPPPDRPPPPPPTDNTEARLRALEAASANTTAAMARLNQVVAEIAAKKDTTMPDPHPTPTQPQIDWAAILKPIIEALLPLLPKLLPQLLPALLPALVPLLLPLLTQWLTGRVAVVAPPPAPPAAAFGLPQGSVTGILGLIGAIVSGLAPMLSQGAIGPEISVPAATISAGIGLAGGAQATKNALTKPKD